MRQAILITICLLFGCSTTDNSGPSKTIAFGSCSVQEKIDQQLWKEVIAEEPNMWIWLGDNIYADTEDMNEMKSDYDLQKSHPDYQKLLEKVDILGIWDDHDFGGNDLGSEYPMKDESRDLLFDFLDVPEDSEARNRKGAYQSYNYNWGGGSVKILLLDTRYFRDSLKWSYEPKQALVNENGEILGKDQWEWLITELNDEDIDFFLVISGIQVLPTEHRFEKWANFPTERKKLMDLIAKTVNVPLVFLSGDRHMSEVSRTELEGYSFPLYEFTSSSLTNPWDEEWEEPNSLRLGQITYPVNFAVMDINWIDKKPSLELNFVGKGNASLQKFSVNY